MAAAGDATAEPGRGARGRFQQSYEDMAVVNTYTDGKLAGTPDVPRPRSVAERQDSQIPPVFADLSLLLSARHRRRQIRRKPNASSCCCCCCCCCSRVVEPGSSRHAEALPPGSFSGAAAPSPWRRVEKVVLVGWLLAADLVLRRTSIRGTPSALEKLA